MVPAVRWRPFNSRKQRSHPGAASLVVRLVRGEGARAWGGANPAIVALSPPRPPPTVRPMRFFGLTPDEVRARAEAAHEVRPPDSVVTAMAYGAGSVGLVSVAAYSIWAYRLVPGAAAMYAAIAAIYLGLAGLALGRLVAGPGGTARFIGLFAVAFAVYAVIWCAFWFGLKGRHHADLYGAAAGLAAMVWLLHRAFGGGGDPLTLFGVLFACHTIGYTLGDDLHAVVRGATGRLLWGLGHGLGFGAGLGYVLHQAQEPLRQRLAAR